MRKAEGIRIFSGATAIITGGASGIGQAVAKQLATLGCDVVVADIQIESAHKVASDILASGGKASAMEVDVTNFIALEQIVKETIQRTGRLDYMFNNAGIGIVGDVNHYNIEDWNYILDVNLHGVINGVQAAYNAMMNQGFGHIVNTASLAGITPCPGMVFPTAQQNMRSLVYQHRYGERPRGMAYASVCYVLDLFALQF